MNKLKNVVLQGLAFIIAFARDVLIQLLRRVLGEVKEWVTEILLERNPFL